jgi:hypothetical protein
MSKLKGRGLVEEQLLKLAPSVNDRFRSTFEESELGARRFAHLVRWKIEPRVHVSKNGCVTFRFIDIGVSMTAFIFLDNSALDYRASMEREGFKYTPYCQGIDTMVNSLSIIKAFGVDLFTI